MFDHIDDPEVRREAERLRRGELVRRDADLARRRSAEGSPVPFFAGPIELSSDDQIERAAAHVIAARRAWRKTPEGRFVAALNEARAALDLAAAAEQDARAAQCRDFDGERPACERWAAALFDAAKRLKSAALDAQLAAMEEPLTQSASESAERQSASTASRYPSR